MRSAFKPWSQIGAVVAALTLVPLAAMAQDPPQAPNADENTDNRRPGNNREFRGGRGRGEERQRQEQTQAPAQITPNADGTPPQQRTRGGDGDGGRRGDGDGGRRDRNRDDTQNNGNQNGGNQNTDNNQSRENVRRHQNFMNGDGNGLANGNRKTDSDQARENVRRQENVVNGNDGNTERRRDRDRGDNTRRNDNDGNRGDGNRGDGNRGGRDGDNNRRVDNDNNRGGDRDRGNRLNGNDRRDNDRGDNNRRDRNRWDRNDWNRHYAGNRNWDWDRRDWNDRRRHGRSRYDLFRYRDPGYRWRGSNPRIILSLNYTWPSTYYDYRDDWRGPLYDEELWLTFEPTVYDALPTGAREKHEQAFLFSLYGPLGRTETWTYAGVRGDITMIDEHYFGNEWCRDFVQSISTPSWKRTTDGRMCIGWGEPWRLVSEY